MIRRTLGSPRGRSHSRRAPPIFGRFFCASFFRERREASPITCPFNDCSSRLESIALGCSLGCWRVKNESDKNLVVDSPRRWRRAAGDKRGRASLAVRPSCFRRSSSLPSSLPSVFLFLLILADLRRAASGGQDGIMSATSQGSRQGRTLSSRAASSRCRSPPARRNRQRHRRVVYQWPAATVILFGASTS